MGSRSAALRRLSRLSIKIYLYDSEGVCELSGALQDTEKTSSVVITDQLELIFDDEDTFNDGSNDTVRDDSS